MITAKKVILVGFALCAALAFAGCGEREVTVYKQGKYQGKPDTRPYDNDPSQALDSTSTWTKGDRSSWEAAMRQRVANQNEYNRTGASGG